MIHRARANCRTAVGPGIVRHHPLDPDAQALKPRRGAPQKARGRWAGLSGEYFAVGEARGVVHAYVHGLPAHAPDPPAAIAMDSVAHSADAHQALGVHMHQLAGARPLVADHRLPRLERAQPIQTQAPQRHDDRRHREPQGARDPRRAPASPPQALDLPHPGPRQLVRTPPWARRPIHQPVGPAYPPAPHPLGHGALAHPKSCRHRPPPLPLLHHAPHQQGSPRRRQLGILMHVH